jgi:glycine/D-amino acid oxidase-like deaminating enzyme
VDSTADVVVIGAGIVGAACAYYLARSGAAVVVLDRGAVAGGTTGAGEGNLLVSDKTPGPELDLTLRSLELWRELGSTLDGEAFELEPKGGLVVAATDEGMSTLESLASAQRELGVVADSAPDPRTHEPCLRDGLAGGVFYPQDMQVQPMLAAAHLLRAAASSGARVRPHAAVTGIQRSASGAVVGVRTAGGRIATPSVVNAAGTWADDVARLAGVELPILPRRGFILVTEPLPVLVRHKVYAAEYVANVASDASDLQTSAVVEGTRGGTILIGASRERVGFDTTFALPVLSRLAAQAVDLFPFLGDVHVLRAYRGFRPYSPDHLPVIGPDPRVPGLVHACGHEGAGIGLAPVTGALVAAAVTGGPSPLDPTPFRPDRFAPEGSHG